MANIAYDWLRQAEHDLKHADLSLRNEDYEWACFASQQAAEKAVKAYYIPARYPNGFPEGSPFEHFGKLQAQEAIKYADEILKFVRSKMGS